jgi:hypothetical protein
MSGDASPNLDDRRLTSKEARDAVIRHGAEIDALAALHKEAGEEMARHEREMARHYRETARHGREMARISEERAGLMYEIEDTFKGFLAASFAEEALKDLEALPETPDERREDGV